MGIYPSQYEHRFPPPPYFDPGLGPDYIPVPLPGGDNCKMTTTAQSLSGVPLTYDQASIEYARDQYLSTTAVGNYVIALWYANEDELVERSKEVKPEAPDRAFAQALYARYVGEAKLALSKLDNGGGLPLTEQHYADAQAAMLSAKKYLKESEVAVMEKVFALLREKAPPGTTPKQALEVLDDEELLARVKELAGSIGYLDTDVKKWTRADPAPRAPKAKPPGGEQKGTP